MLRAHVAELQDKSKAQAEQIDALHKQMAEQKMQAGGKPTVAPVLANIGTNITELVRLVRELPTSSMIGSIANGRYRGRYQ